MVWDISLNVHYSTYVSFTSISCIIYFEHKMQFIWKCMMHWFLYVVYYYYFDIQLIKTELLQWNSHYYTINISNFKYLHLVFYNSTFEEKKSLTFGFNTSLSQRVERAPIMSISMTSSQMLLPISNKPNVIHYFTTQSWIQKQPRKRALMHINQFENLVNASTVNFMMISKLHKLLPKKKLSQVLTS